jgi:hypothetical protein
MLVDKSKVKCFKCHKYDITNLNIKLIWIGMVVKKSNFIEKKGEMSLSMANHMNEKNHQNLWYLDIECSNHLSGDKSIFSNLD